MLKKKFPALFLLLAMLLALAGCSGKSGTGRGSDWARYANRPGMLMVMDEAYLFFNPEWQYIQATDSECSIAPMPICTKAECTHSDSSCSAYVELPTYFYSWGDRIYYIQLDDGAGLYSMSMTGEERKQELALSVLDTQAGNISYNCYVGEGYLLLYVWTADLATDAQSCKLYLYDLSDTKAEPVTIYSAQDDSQINYHMYVMDGWAFYSLSSEEQNGALYGYEIATGQTTELVQNWADRNSLTVKDGVLYWCAVNRGIYSVELASGTSTEYQRFDTGDIAGAQGYDDQYIYLSYLTDTPKVVIYYYEGKQIAEKTFDSADELPIYYFCSADRAYFSYTGQQGADLYSLPVCYLEEADVAKGNANFIFLSYND